jgi:thiosulfate dehydrogenase [quinone] large subunit
MAFSFADGLDRSGNMMLALTRIALGWLFFYAGITKVLDQAWSAKGFLLSSKTFTGFYAWLASDGILPIVDFINKWGLTLLGVALILGLCVRLASLLGALLMVLYWFPVLTFPTVAHGYLVDEHIIYALVLLYFAAVKAGRWYGLENACARLPICTKHPRLRAWLG